MKDMCSTPYCVHHTALKSCGVACIGLDGPKRWRAVLQVDHHVIVLPISYIFTPRFPAIIAARLIQSLDPVAH